MKQNTLFVIGQDMATLEEIREIAYYFPHTQVEAFAKGEEAIQFSRKTKPSLIISELILEGSLDGIQTIHHLSKRREVPVIFLISSYEPQLLSLTRTTQIVNYFVKPFKPRELEFAMEMALWSVPTSKKRSLFE